MRAYGTPIIESYSSIEDYQRCPVKYRWRNVEGLQRKKRNVAFYWGSEAHSMFKVFAIALQEGATIGQALVALDDHAAQRCKDAKTEKTYFAEEKASAVDIIQQAHAMVSRYLDRNWDESWEVLHVEEQFTWHIDEDHVLTFTPDLIVRDRNGNVWIIDWKTTAGSVPDVPDIPFEDLQVLSYSAGVHEIYPELKGFIFVRLRKKTPALPRLNKTKKDGLYWVNNLKTIDTTYEILHQFIEEQAPALLKHPAHALRLAELRETDRFHWVERVLVTPEMRAEAAQNLVDTMDHIEYSQQEDLYYRVYSAANFGGCKGCPFQSLCRSQVLGYALDSVIEEEYEPRDTSYKDYETEEEPF